MLGSLINESPADCKSSEASFKSSDKKSLVIADRSSKVLRAYDPHSKSWTQMQALHQDMVATFGYTAVMVNNFIYVLFNDRKAYRLNIKLRSSNWEKVSDMKKEHVVPAAAVCGGDIYVVGGNSIERYRTSESEWKEINSTGISNCSFCALAVHDNNIYTIGGWNGKRILADVNRYSPPTSSWSSVAPMPNQSHLAAACVCNDKIYVAGGYNSGFLDNFSSFDPRVGAWTQLSKMMKCRYYFRLCIAANQIYAVGSGNRACSIEMYDFDEAKWNVVTDEDNNMKIMAPATVAIELPQS